MKKSKKDENGFFSYKGRPLVRSGNIVYYGDMNEQYVVKIESTNSKKEGNLDVSTHLIIEMLDTNADITSGRKILKVSEKNGLYPALDIASAWLERATGA